jgi:hypothetical protein
MDANQNRRQKMNIPPISTRPPRRPYAISTISGIPAKLAADAAVYRVPTKRQPGLRCGRHHRAILDVDPKPVSPCVLIDPRQVLSTLDRCAGHLALSGQDLAAPFHVSTGVGIIDREPPQLVVRMSAACATMSAGTVMDGGSRRSSASTRRFRSVTILLLHRQKPVIVDIVLPCHA